MPGIIVNDDDSSVRTYLVSCFEFEGYKQVYGTSSSEKALAKMGELGGLDLLVTDDCMPGLGGINLIHRMRSQGILVPIILYCSQQVSTWEAHDFGEPKPLVLGKLEVTKEKVVAEAIKIIGPPK